MSIKASRKIVPAAFFMIALLVVTPYVALCETETQSTTDQQQNLYEYAYAKFYKAGKEVGVSDAKNGKPNNAQYWAEKARGICYTKLTGLSGDQLNNMCDVIESATYLGYQTGYRGEQARGQSS